jgi:hypothetical protein
MWLNEVVQVSMQQMDIRSGGLRNPVGRLQLVPRFIHRSLHALGLDSCMTPVITSVSSLMSADEGKIPFSRKK